MLRSPYVRRYLSQLPLVARLRCGCVVRATYGRGCDLVIVILVISLGPALAASETTLGETGRAGGDREVQGAPRGP